MILVIDNYDSFTYNLVQALGELGADLEVRRNDRITVAEAGALRPTGIVLSPGPGRPEAAGCCCEMIDALAAEIPILGVCLGHQAIAAAFGGTVVRAPEVVHGKIARVRHDRRRLFSKLPEPLEATRYHSLVVARDDLPPELEVSAWTDDGLIMGLRHREMLLFGVQFHPESIATPAGPALLSNFLEICRGQSC
jgi:anthranilate synthase/aminodeoxychorismate synthase-like glutamine amidotransferase